MMDYKAAIREASDAAAEAPEELREIAFRTVLERLLGTSLPDTSTTENEGSPALGSNHGPTGQRPDWREQVVTGLPEAYRIQEDGNRAQQAVWAVVTLQSRGVEVTSEAIMNVIRTELGIAPQNSMNTARTLRKLTPRFVMRRDRPDGRGYVYEPTARALDAFEGLDG
jgi:hypothetical protein